MSAFEWALILVFGLPIAATVVWWVGAAIFVPISLMRERRRLRRLT